MKKLQLLIYTVVVLCALGALLSAGHLRNLFAEMLLLLALFLIVVELVPQYIVGDEKKQTHNFP